MAPKKIWSRAETLSLIEKYKIHGLLWDPQNYNYKNKSKIKEVLQKLADEFETSYDEIVRKIHNLKTQFAQELKKMRSRRQPGGKKYKCKWEYFQIMSTFMMAITPKPANQGKSKATNAPPVPEIPEPIECTPPIKLEETQPPPEEDDFEEIPAKSGSCDDEYQIFGDYVANELRNMHFQQYKNDLKRKIQRLIIEYTEMDDNEYFSTKMEEQSEETEQPSTSAGLTVEYDVGIVKTEVIVPDPENE